MMGKSAILTWAVHQLTAKGTFISVHLFLYFVATCRKLNSNLVFLVLVLPAEACVVPI